jgi:predicted porin
MTLTPTWNWSNEKVYLSLGANVDLRTSKEDRILASPMIVINQNLKTTKNADFMLLTEITGGVMDNNMRSLWSVSPYWTSKNKIKDGYTLIDFYSGVSMSLTDKVTFVIGNGYSYTKNAIFQTLSDSIIVSSMLEQHNSGLFYNKLTVDVEMSSLLNMRFAATHYDWTNKDLGKALAYKPVWDLTLDSRLIITEALDLIVSYNFSNFHKYEGKAINSVNNLSVGADYRFRNNFSLFADLNNIFNSSHYYYAGYMAQKFNFVLGGAYRF